MKLTQAKDKKKPKGKLNGNGKPNGKERAFPIVAIGASAGGLEAVTQLLQNLPADTGMAFIYVQHLSPDHKSILTSLLSKSTLMKVQEVTNKILMVPNNLYVIPPDKEMIVLDGHIKLTPRAKGRVVNLPIDTFFSSLAEKHKEGAIGIVLSGSASDGTRGLKAIKEAGGLTFAQDDSAKFGSMPRSAIAAGAVDFVLPPKGIARELSRLSNHDYMKRELVRKGNEGEIGNSSPELRVILNLLFKETGVDFGHYKLATIKRRINRRMLLNRIRTISEYAKSIEKTDEINVLYQDLLINVTGFFRDTGAHEYLKTTLFPRILKSKGAGETLRIWIPACSSGEEAFSIAMMLLEVQSSKSLSVPIQIFATDLSAQAIAKARVGEYSKHEVASVSPTRLQRFYLKSGGNYRISKIVRDMCVFATHNILRDPPFSRIDFISCCNLLIYLDIAAQKKVITTFYYALVASGYLMLGKSETVGKSGQLFTQIHKKFKIYARKKSTGVRILPDLTRRNYAIEKNAIAKPVKNKPVQEEGFDKSIDAILLSRYVPACVVINRSMEIQLFRGPTDLYLRHSSGKANLNILKMVPPEIAFELRSAISKTFKTKRPVVKEGLEMKVDVTPRMINLEVIPISELEEPLLLILFIEPELVEIQVPSGKGGKSNSVAKDRMIVKFRKELSSARADMQALAQEQESFNVELQNANEEVVSSNEELQSVNEELETSKEEIEATNEELVTSNQELQTRNDLLNESYDYSEAIITTIHEPMIILDKELRVRSANKAFYTTFKVTPDETERTLLYDLGNKQWDIPKLRQLLEEIIPKNAHFLDFEVTHTFPWAGEKIMSLNARRIVQKTHGEQLILLAINDVTERTLLQRKEKELLKKDIRESKSYSLTLEKAVEERTKELELANKTLEERNAELGKMNTELEAFAYVSSHDLQEPLRKIQAFGNRILDTEKENLTDRGKDYFGRMQSAAKRMQRLIEDLLSFSRLSIAERKYENTDLSKIVEEVKTDLKEIIDEKHATVEATDLCEVNIIPFQFRQLMHNLISNALKFSRPGKPIHIKIKSRIEMGAVLKDKNLLPEKKYCHISVSDNGIGFDPQYKDRIFEVFQKLHGKEEYPGTGIGLAIVKKVVQNHNGFISVASQLNKGAAFNIYIPVS
jgi:two-component system CheB/CheR fusion protein